MKKKERKERKSLLRKIWERIVEATSGQGCEVGKIDLKSKEEKI